MADTGVAGRVVIVTGGGAGIGRGLVRHLGHAGARVVVAEWRTDRLTETVDELTTKGIECLGVECDVSRRDSIKSMVDATVDRFGGVDGLVNNAMTITDFVPLAELDEAQLDVNITSGLKGTLWAMQAVYPHMKGAHWGRIVNVGSAAGIVGFKGMGAYAATKEAIRALTRTAAREWAVDGIVVNLYCPVSTRHYEGTDQLLTEYKQEGMAVVEALSPTGYDGDAEDDIGPVVAFLLSDACRYLTGQTLMLDGGTYAFA